MKYPTYLFVLFTHIVYISIMKIELENYMTINEFMAKHKIKSRRTVYNWIESGKVEIRKVLDRTVVRFK